MRMGYRTWLDGMEGQEGRVAGVFWVLCRSGQRRREPASHEAHVRVDQHSLLPDSPLRQTFRRCGTSGRELGKT
jgi:hypothetical protein